MEYLAKKLRYTEFGISHAEVPGESCLCIYISGCPNKCPDCYYPLLQSPSEGELLRTYYEDILDLYSHLATCVCFLGEGDLSAESRNEMIGYVEKAHDKGFSCCLYSGRDIEIESWMKCFEYVKTSSYRKALGGLEKSSTNQRLFKKMGNQYIDITKSFSE